MRQLSWTKGTSLVLDAASACGFLVLSLGLTYLINGLGRRPFLAVFFAAILAATISRGLRAGMMSLFLCILASGSMAVWRTATLADAVRLAIFAAISCVFVRYVAYARQNICELKRKRGELDASQKRFRAIYQSAPLAIGVADESGHLLSVNPAYCRMFGYSEQELVGRDIRDLVTPEEAATIPPDFFKNLQAEVIVPYVMERSYRRKDGSLFQGRLTVGTFVADDATRRPMAMIEDVTRERQAYHALAESEARFRLLFESPMVGLATSNLHGDVLTCNDEFLRIVDFSREEFEKLGLNKYKLTPPECADQDARHQELILREGVCPPFEKRYYRKDNSLIPVVVRGALLPTRNEIVWIVLDNSGKKKLEARLEHAHRMEAIGRLAGGVAHDLNNVLMVTMSYAELLSQQLGSDPTLSRYAGEILSAGKRGATVVQQLLSYSRRRTIQPRILDLSQTVEDSLRMVRRIIGDDISVQFKPFAKLWKIKADPANITDVLFNLAANSRDAMPDGGQFRMYAANFELREAMQTHDAAMPPGRYVVLEVADSGVGIKPSVREHIFEPFFTTREFGQASGLGLASVYGIVKQHGGFITVHSCENAGTVFRIFFPVCDASESPAAVDVPRIREHAVVLLVEDDSSARESIASYLSSCGISVFQAGSAREALALLENYSGPLDLVITDIFLPGSHGNALVEQLSQRYSRLPVIFMSARCDHSFDIPSRPASFFLQKPFMLGSLCEVVGNALQESRDYVQ